MFIKLNLPTYSIRVKEEDGKTFLFDRVRKKFLVFSPEEWVRQNFIHFLLEEKHFPESLMAVETGLTLNRKQFRADLLIYDRKGKPLMVVEFKAPSVKISQDTFDQIVRYNMSFQVPYLVVSNGLNHYCCLVDLEKQSYAFLKEVPDFGQICGGY